MAPLHIALLLSLAFNCLAASAVEFPTDPLRLWSGPAPGALGEAEKDIPTLTPFWPAPGTATGAAFIVCPGGGYRMLADHEGKGYADFFVQSGICCFVASYRLGGDGFRHPAMLEDALATIHTVRQRASEWGIDPAKIGVMGSSAGGHLTAHSVTAYGQYTGEVSLRPDFGILCYPVIAMSGAHCHTGSRGNLLGEDASEAAALAVSPLA